MLVFVTGCPVFNPDPCASDPCDDGLFCNGTETCTAEGGEAVCGDGTAVECDAGLVCDNDAEACIDLCADVTCDDGNDCTDDACNPQTGNCVSVNNDATCDDGDDCTEGDVCADGACAGTDIDCDDADACTTDACVAGVCENTAVECDAGKSCVVGVCVVVCAADADCDDGTVCTADTCVLGVCLNAPIDCPDDGLFCTGVETCDAVTGCTASGDPCGADEVCDEDTDTCEASTVCAVDGDCDDGDFCTTDTCGADLTCDFTAVDCDDSDACTVDACDAADGSCTNTAMVCEAGETCVDGTCTATGAFNFTLDDDTLNGSAGDDVFTAGTGTLNPADIAVGGGGSDTVNASIVGASSSLATLLQMNSVNFTTLNNSTFDAANCAAIGAYSADGSSAGSLTLTNLEDGVDFAMGSGFAFLFDAGLAGAGAAFTLTLNGTAAGATFDNTAPGGLDMTIDVAADSSIDCAVPATDCFGGASGVTVTGAGNLLIADVKATDLVADGGAWDVTDHTGSLTVRPFEDFAVDLNFTSGGADDLDGVDQVTIADTATFAHTIVFALGDGNVTVDVSEIDADDLAGALTLTQGANTDDILTLNLGGDGDGCGTVLAVNSETVNIVSGGTTANAIANVTSETATPFVTETVAVTGTQDCDLGTVTSEVFDSTALAIGAGVTLTLGASMQANTGGGDDDITGSGTADLIDAGAGDDTILGGAGIDAITGGDGVDTFDFDTVVLAANASNIADFVGGASGDVLRFDAATFTDYTDGATVTFDTAAGGTAGATGANDDVILVDTAANILAYNSADATDAVIAIATDTGNVYYDADGNFTAGPVVIGNITTAEVANLVAANIEIVP